MLHLVALVRTDDLEQLSASFIWETRIGELGTTLAVTSNRRTLRRKYHLVFLRSVRRLLGGGTKFLRNVGSYKIHTV
jgi:hypothetical protein